MKYLLLVCFLFNSAKAQIWPTKDCPDIPYSKGNDGRIYHTCDCGVKASWAFFSPSPGDTILCRVCGQHVSMDHIRDRIKEGSLKPYRDKTGCFPLTDFGKQWAFVFQQ